MVKEFKKVKDIFVLLEVHTKAQKHIQMHMVQNFCLCLNPLPLVSGISMEYSPREIVIKQSVDYKKYCRSEFESYVESSTDDMVTNSQTPRTHGCIALGASRNR